MTIEGEYKKDKVDGEVVLVLRSGKCAWGKCFACGWGKESYPVDVDALKKKVMERVREGAKRVKVFGSGSFLDDKQFPREFRKWFVGFLKERGVKELIIESRPEFITEENLQDFKGIKTTVAIGLECADNEVLLKYKKGFRVEDYIRAVNVLKKNGFGVRTYLMVNMPFSDESKLHKSVEFALKYSDSVVLINTFPHSKSELFDYWLQGKWKPLDKEEFEKVVGPWKDNPKVELDFQNFAFLPRFPREKRVFIKGATIEALHHPHFEVWQDYIQRFYEKPKNKDIILFLPCSKRKPYFKSKTHRIIHRVLIKSKLYPRIHKVVVSTPGVVPREFWGFYPFTSYDWPEWEETPEVMQEYVNVNKERVKRYLERHKYVIYLAFLKYTETWEAVKKGCEELGIEVKNLLKKETWERIRDRKNPIIQEEALADLKNGLELLEKRIHGKD